MVDRERLLSKIDQFDQYLRELSQVCPTDLVHYQRVEIRRCAYCKLPSRRSWTLRR